jgi:hypothetical protein
MTTGELWSLEVRQEEPMRVAQAAIPLLLLVLSQTPAHANLVSDPSFESCAATGFDSSPPDWSGLNGFCAPSVAHSGDWAGGIQGTMATASLDQTIPTTAGQIYEFSWWQSYFAPPAVGEGYGVSFGNTPVFGFSSSIGASAPYAEEEVMVTATSGETTIDFSAARLTAIIDDITVTEVLPMVEPTSLILAVTACLGLAAARICLWWRDLRFMRPE